MVAVIVKHGIESKSTNVDHLSPWGDGTYIDRQSLCCDEMGFVVGLTKKDPLAVPLIMLYKYTSGVSVRPAKKF
jgi:hypothetical protein